MLFSKQSKRTVLCSFSIFTILLASSCGKSTQRSITPKNDTPPQPLETANTLSLIKGPQPSQCDADLCVAGELSGQSISTVLEFAVDKQSAQNLIFNIKPETGDITEWSASCDKDKVTTEGTKCTITFSPKSMITDMHNATVTYSYINSLGNTVKSTDNLTLTYKLSSLIEVPQNMPSQIDINNFSKITFFNSLPIAGLSSFKTSSSISPSSFYSLPTTDYANVTDVKSYITASIYKTIINQRTTQKTAVYDKLNNSLTPLEGVKLTSQTENSAYGCGTDGSLFKINLTDDLIDTTYLTNLQTENNSIDTCIASIGTFSDEILTLSHNPTTTDGMEPADVYLCSTDTQPSEQLQNASGSISSFNSACYSDAVSNTDQKNTLAEYDGVIYLQTYNFNKNIYSINAYQYSADRKNLIPSKIFSSLTFSNSAPVDSMVFNPNSKLIYVTLQFNDSNHFALISIDSLSGKIKWSKTIEILSPTDGSSVLQKISAPFITSSGNVIVIDYKANIYGYNKEGNSVFLSGNSLNALQFIPSNVKPKNLNLNLVSNDLSSKVLNIPVTTVTEDGSKTSYTFPVKMDW
jgi:hypothetical protein